MNEIAPVSFASASLSIPVDRPGHSADPACGRAPMGLLAELTHKCPLQCPYCSNPLEMDKPNSELSTAEWQRVFREAVNRIKTLQQPQSIALHDCHAATGVRVLQLNQTDWTVLVHGFRRGREQISGDRPRFCKPRVAPFMLRPSRKHGLDWKRPRGSHGPSVIARAQARARAKTRASGRRDASGRFAAKTFEPRLRKHCASMPAIAKKKPLGD